MQILSEQLSYSEKVAIIKDDIKNFAIPFEKGDVEKMRIFYERIKNLMED
ncbi:MAG: hypothetical protein MJZ34_07370 [Paludibacteraceae bacterium]|nr:hypothetical protein [Paludibacteraceae bacterium]